MSFFIGHKEEIQSNIYIYRHIFIHDIDIIRWIEWQQYILPLRCLHILVFQRTIWV